MTQHYTNTPDFQTLYADTARDFYAIYCASSGGKNFQGNPCPAFDDLPAAVQGHWRVVAHRALEWISGDESKPSQSLASLPDPAAALATYRRYLGTEAG